MDPLTGPALVTAGLLVVAGALKVVDPEMTVGALRALGLPSSPSLVRAGAAAEAALGVAALAVGGPVLWGLVATSYLAFGAFVAAARRAGTMVGSCGCFGREETPPHPVHIALDLVLTAAAVAVAATVDGAPLAGVADDPGAGAVVVGLSALALHLAHAAFVELPRALAAGAEAAPRAPRGRVGRRGG
ncbi:MAG TPA: MauE/DoxX family redox-associated membrane protein [Acidimicrobiales bacterium]|nr:MauE/DoxX family redox-associated membrane protein [Acidimicrobiales bacterium]